MKGQPIGYLDTKLSAAAKATEIDWFALCVAQAAQFALASPDPPFASNPAFWALPDDERLHLVVRSALAMPPMTNKEISEMARRRRRQEKPTPD